MTESVWAHFTGGPHHGKTMRVPNHPRIQLPELRAFAVVAVDTAGLFPDLTSCSTYDRAWPRKRKLIVIEDSPPAPSSTNCLP